MTATRINLTDMVVFSELAGEAVQPWSDRPCFKYRVHINARRGAHVFTQDAYGSQADYENGDSGHAEELAWLVLHDLLSAYDDPEEFFELAFGEPDAVSLDRVRGILSVIDFAVLIGETLEVNREAIAEAYDAV